MHDEREILRRGVLDCYRDDADQSVAAIACKLGSTSSKVDTQIKQLKGAGVLAVVAAVDLKRVGRFPIEAYVEVAFPGNTNVHSLLNRVANSVGRAEIREAIVLVGETDAFVRVRAESVSHLYELITEIRAGEFVLNTNTRIVAAKWPPDDSRRQEIELEDPDSPQARILECYEKDPLATKTQVAQRVPCNVATVRKQVNRLKDASVLAFAAVIDYDQITTFSIEAYIEVKFAGNSDVHALLLDVLKNIGRPAEIREAITLIGDVDALLRVRVGNVIELRDLVMVVRASGPVEGTKTSVVAGRWWHGTDLQAGVSNGA